MGYLYLVMLLFFAVYCLVNPLTVLFHELGHALPILLASDQNVTIYIGSYGNESNSFRIGRGRMSVWIKPTLRKKGLCTYSTGLPLRVMIISTLSGPLLSLLVGILACYLIFMIDAHGMIKLVTVVFLVSTIIDLFTNLVPRERSITLENGKTTYNDGYILFYLIRHGKMPAYEFMIDADGFIDPDEAEKFLAHRGEVIFSADFYRHLIAANLHKNKNNRALEFHMLLAQNYNLTSDDYCKAGIIYGKMRLEKEALAAFDTALSIDNSYIYNWINRGYYLYILEQYTSAREDLDKAISINPEFASAYSFRSILNVKMKQLPEALSDANKAISLEPDDPFAHFALGLFYIENNIKEKALAHLNRAEKQKENIYLYEESLARANALCSR